MTIVERIARDLKAGKTVKYENDRVVGVCHSKGSIVVRCNPENYRLVPIHLLKSDSESFI